MKKIILGVALFAVSTSLAMSARQHCVVFVVAEPCMTMDDGSIGYCFEPRESCHPVFPIFGDPESDR